MFTDKILAELKFLVFAARYCAGHNLIESKMCLDLLPWVGGVAGLIALYFVWRWLKKKIGAWLWVRSQSKVASEKTMDEVRWTGHDPRK
jgi:hypothetical protein